MKIQVLFFACTLVTKLVGATLVTPFFATEGEFTLTRSLPGDVFLCVAQRHNPERAFIDQHWGEVLEAFNESGATEEAVGLVSALMGLGNADAAAELDALKERALELVAGVDWMELAAKELVFAERLVQPLHVSQENPPILMANMVWMLRGSTEGAAHNYQGLVRILEALAREVNAAAGREALTLNGAHGLGPDVARLELTPAPTISLSVARRDDVIVIGLRDQLFGDVMALLDGTGEKQALADHPSYKAAFSRLPKAEDTLSFFNMQALLQPLQATVATLIDTGTSPRDVYRNSAMERGVSEIHQRSLTAYRAGDIDQALLLTEEAHSLAPDNPTLLFNLACFNTLAGNPDEGLNWLEKAVEAGFWAPRKIAGDGDLARLRGTPAFQAVKARAAELAMLANVPDIVENYTDQGEVYRLRMQVHRTYETEDYEQGLELIKQAYAIAPDDSKVLYTLGCLHALLGHEEEGLAFLERAVEAGFYCPRHIEKDPDLMCLAEKPRLRALVSRAYELAAERARGQQAEKLDLAHGLLDRIASAVGVLDYIASVGSTEAHTTSTETLAVLVPDARKRPIYAVFGEAQQLADFGRYLPRETASFSVSGGVDLRALYQFFIETLAAAGPGGERALDGLNDLQAQLELDLGRDVLGWIGESSVSVTLEAGRGSVLMVAVRDEALARKRVSATIAFACDKIPELAKRNPGLAAGLAMLGLRTSAVEGEALAGFQNLHLGMSPEPLVWGVTDGHIIFGSSAEAIALCLATAAGDHPDIRENPRAMGEALLPVGPFASVTFTDRRNLGQELEAGLRIAGMTTGMMGAFIPEPKVRPVLAKISGLLDKLAPVARTIDFYKSQASLTTFDGQAWHTRFVTHYRPPQEPDPK